MNPIVIQLLLHKICPIRYSPIMSKNGPHYSHVVLANLRRKRSVITKRFFLSTRVTMNGACGCSCHLNRSGKHLHSVVLSGYWHRDVITGQPYYPCSTPRPPSLVISLFLKQTCIGILLSGSATLYGTLDGQLFLRPHFLPCRQCSQCSTVSSASSLTLQTI